MNKQKIIMGMKVNINVVDKCVTTSDFNDVFNYLKYIDEKFSTYKKIARFQK